MVLKRISSSILYQITALFFLSLLVTIFIVLSENFLLRQQSVESLTREISDNQNVLFLMCLKENYVLLSIYCIRKFKGIFLQFFRRTFSPPRLGSGLPARCLRARSTACMVSSWWRRRCASSRPGPGLSLVSRGASAIASSSVETARVESASRWLPTCPRRGSHA